MYYSCIFIKLLSRAKRVTLLSRAKRVTLYLRSSFSMMYPEGPQVYTQCFPEKFGGGGGGGGGPNSSKTASYFLKPIMQCARVRARACALVRARMRARACVHNQKKIL